MAKTNFDEIVNDSLNVIDKAQETKLASDAFKSFIDKPITNLVNAYRWDDKDVLIEVFKYAPESEMSIQINAKGDTSDINKIRYFSFAKVLAAGPESKYKAGEIVKLRDTDSLSIETSKYKSWVDNPMSKSNLKQKGEEPQRYVSNIFKSLGPYAFILNPLDLAKLDSHVDDAVYKVSDAKIENVVKDVDILFGSC